ncbi:glycosyltransferase 36 [Halorhabdus utahensis DSM 12940]|uniref:Glycosyltransferase 36 n=1 Tax=Halorhabdus utahensis (strain DSM 12940 / JCM 11049 / AX-2) TaxID=519442 RepID=C7NND9_HALUD|nr:glycosyl hydrolase family 65 protein [Halorhabdus utahensis]ACV11539.1 glycosyltransferase 36 [Halorhabdus utahensis DSM 12940]
MKYGHFDDDAREYVITEPETPRPWINYIGRQDYVGMISNTGGGYSFYQDPRYRRLVRYRYNNAPRNVGGRGLYLRDAETGEYFSPTWQPARVDLDDYECRHGLGYTTIRGEKDDIAAEVTYFVPPGEDLEAWRVTVENDSNESRSLQLFSLVEFCLWDAMDDISNYQRNYNTGEVEVEDSVIYQKTEYRERRNHFAYFACSADIDGFDTQRDAFLGNYEGFDEPAVLEAGEATDSIATGWAPIGSHQVDMELEPGESEEIVFLLGYHENPEDEKFEEPGVVNKEYVEPTIGKYCDPAALDDAFDELTEFWEGQLSALQVETPDPETDRMVNTWNAYQNTVTMNLARSASMYETGLTRGIGFRDSLQDQLAVLHQFPDRARQRILNLAKIQLKDGGAYHQYTPLTGEGNGDIGGGFNDDPMWLVMSTAAYVKETGDTSILDEEIVFENEPGTEAPLAEHLQRAVEYVRERRGPHDLPLIGHADWNDCLNLNCFSENPDESFQTAEHDVEEERAESVFIGGQFVYALQELAELAEQTDILPESAEEYQGYADEMAEAVADAGWDGEWFRRAYDHYSDPIGSSENDEGQIFVESNGMCGMAGIGRDEGKVQDAMDSVRERLATEHGIVLHQPAFTEYDKRYGEITSYPPGYKENGSVFCHTNPWIMITEAKLGNGERAYEYYKRICPAAREDISDTHTTEPYVYAQTIAGPDAPTTGEAKNSWLTGTAAWNYVAITQHILGVRPDHDGLVVDPAIPADWDEYEVHREFRGATYEITVENPNNVESGVDRVEVDGEEIDGQTIPDLGDGKTHDVRVVMG